MPFNRYPHGGLAFGTSKQCFQSSSHENISTVQPFITIVIVLSLEESCVLHYCFPIPGCTSAYTLFLWIPIEHMASTFRLTFSTHLSSKSSTSFIFPFAGLQMTSFDDQRVLHRRCQTCMVRKLRGDLALFRISYANHLFKEICIRDSHGLLTWSVRRHLRLTHKISLPGLSGIARSAS